MLPQPKRLLSVDVFRAVNMFFMIFVNDLSGVSHVPKWIDHVKGWEDGMHFADTIFPLFLFIAGLSIPLGIDKRINRGESSMSIAGHILLRSFALIVMGFFHVNMEEYSRNALIPLGYWELLLTISFFLIWLDYPETMSKIIKYVLMALGVVILAVLAYFYQGTPRGLHPSWWGILGIIGWAYLVCALPYLFAKGRLTAMFVTLFIYVAINFAIHADWIDIKIWGVNDLSSASLMMFGVVFSMLYPLLLRGDDYRKLWYAFTTSGFGMIVLGFIVRPYTHGISKIHSTPSWIFICTGLGILLFEFFIWLIDVKRRQKWFNIIKPAGTSTLTCYLVPYLMVAIFLIFNIKYPSFFNEGIGGILRSFAVCFVVIFITGLLERWRIRLKI